MENKSDCSTLTMTDYIAKYRKNNPEKVQRWKLASAVHLLERNGYKVIPPASSSEEGESK